MKTQAAVKAALKTSKFDMSHARWLWLYNYKSFAEPSLKPQTRKNSDHERKYAEYS